MPARRLPPLSDLAAQRLRWIPWLLGAAALSFGLIERVSRTIGSSLAATVSTRGMMALVISGLIGAVIGGITVLIMRACMNTKRPQRSAGSYLNDSSYHLRTNQDLFLYSNVTKTRIQQESSSSGGGGSSVHTSSSGSSHGGGGGKF